MDFKQIAARFEHAESGTDAFKAFYKDAFELMKADPDNAGLYFVVAVAGHSYVRAYEDQGVTPEFADAAKATLAGLNAKLLRALASDPQERLRLLGEVANEYEWNVSGF